MPFAILHHDYSESELVKDSSDGVMSFDTIRDAEVEKENWKDAQIVNLAASDLLLDKQDIEELVVDILKFVKVSNPSALFNSFYDNYMMNQFRKKYY